MTEFQKRELEARTAFQKEMDAYGLTVSGSVSGRYVGDDFAATFRTEAIAKKGCVGMIRTIRSHGYKVEEYARTDKSGKRYFVFVVCKTVMIPPSERVEDTTEAPVPPYSVKDFLPETTIGGKRGFYPAMNDEEYRALPLPMKCATWDASVKYVIFDTFFSDYGFSARVEVHAEHAFKALFKASDKDTQLYSVCAVRTHDGREIAAKWWQDSTTGAFRITTLSGKVLGTQGGFRGHLPENCKKNASGEWALYPKEYDGGGKLIRVSF